MSGKRWILRSDHALLKDDGVRNKESWLEILLAHRDITDEKEKREFIQASWEGLSPAYALLNMDVAIERIEYALIQDEKICIFGDYDVDGMSAVALLRRCFQLLGKEVDYYIPDRLQEGYGMNEIALKGLQEQGVDLVITVDNGIAAAELITDFPKLDFIITDHHEITQHIPKAILLNPLLDEDLKAAFRNLCGAGVAFFLARALLEAFHGEKAQELILGLLPYVAVATVADVVALTGDNRILVKKGLEEIQKNPPSFIAALWPSILEGKALDSSHIAFQIAPRINACGRLGRADLGLALLETTDFEKARALAQEADLLNERRKAIETSIYKEALLQWEKGSPAVMALGKEWHEGVIGIVASRLVERTHRPSVVCRLNEEGEVTCSARSIPGISLSELLSKHAAYLTAYGGHAMAAGFRLRNEQWENFRNAFFMSCEEALKKVGPQPLCTVDAVLAPEDITFNLYEAVKALEPYGEGNPEPLFLVEKGRPLSARRVGQEDDHLILQLAKKGGDALKAVYFRYPQQSPLPEEETDFLGKIVLNDFRGQKNLELHLNDLRSSWMSFNPSLNELMLSSAPFSRLRIPKKTQGIKETKYTIYPHLDAAFRAFDEGEEQGKGLLLAEGPSILNEHILEAAQNGKIERVYMSRAAYDALPGSFQKAEAHSIIDERHNEDQLKEAFLFSNFTLKEAVKHALQEALERGIWILFYVDTEEERIRLLKFFREKLTREDKDRILSLSPSSVHFEDFLLSVFDNEVGGVMISSSHTPWEQAEKLFDRVFLLDLPLSIESANRIIRLSKKNCCEALWNEISLTAQEKEMRQRHPDRTLLGKVFQGLRAFAGPQLHPLILDEALARRLSRFLKEPIYPSLLRASTRIFSEIGLMDIAKDGDVRYIRLIKQKHKLDLTDSFFFREGLAQHEAFQKLRQVVYSDIDERIGGGGDGGSHHI